MANVVADSNDPNVAAVHGTHTKGFGGSAAIIGQSEGRGVLGVSGAGQGVWGASTSSAGVVGVSESGDAISGSSKSATGVVGVSDEFQGVRGVSHASGHGAVVGMSDNAVNGIGVYGLSESATLGAGIFGENKAPDGLAGFFKGKVQISKNLRVEGDVEIAGDIRLTNADCAEDFDICDSEQIEPGTVMILAEEGVLHRSVRAYDKRVAGVISGAGSYKPGIVLDNRGSQDGRKALALLGKVFCKVDASYGPVRVGDLLTTSATPGYAMRAADGVNAFGAVIGKALRSLDEGQGLIPILITLH